MGDYLVVQSDTDAEGSHRLSSDVRRLAEANGLRVSDLGPGIWIGTGGVHPPASHQVGPWQLFGDVFNRRQPVLPAVVPGDPFDYERKLVARVWGRFVGIRLDRNHRVSQVIRDPSGALECLTWLQDGLTFLASDAPDWLVRRLRPAWAINVRRLDAALRDPLMASGPLLLDGPLAIAPGTLQPMPPTSAPVSLWNPVDFATRSAGPQPSVDAAARSVRSAICEATAALAGLSTPVAAEVSGGLDSSLIAICLREAGIDVALWLNAYGSTPESDERTYLAALARALDIEPLSVPHATGPMTEAGLETMSQGLRPGLTALDLHHDLDWAERIPSAGARAVLTGKGGDSILVQATEDVFSDLWARRGWRALFDPDTPRLATTTERSVWTLARDARRRLRRGEALPLRDEGLLSPSAPARDIHPWLVGAEAFGPAKRFQILGVANVVARHGPSALTRAVDVRHPLCAQPVIEACLSLPTPLLTWGGRDRGLARLAFRDRLPEEIYARRSKGNMTRIYARMIFENLDVLRPWLLDGRLAAMGIIDRAAAEQRLTRESLIWRGRYSAIIVAAAFEGWVRVWERRLAPSA